MPNSKSPSARNLAGRRTVLKGGAVATGSAIGSGVPGDPMIWAQDLKDVTLNQAGQSLSLISGIAEKEAQSRRQIRLW